MKAQKDVEKRDVVAKSRINYPKVISQLLTDNKLLQHKLNETLQALRRCMEHSSSNCLKNKVSEVEKIFFLFFLVPISSKVLNFFKFKKELIKVKNKI